LYDLGISHFYTKVVVFSLLSGCLVYIGQGIGERAGGCGSFGQDKGGRREGVVCLYGEGLCSLVNVFFLPFFWGGFCFYFCLGEREPLCSGSGSGRRRYFWRPGFDQLLGLFPLILQWIFVLFVFLFDFPTSHIHPAHQFVNSSSLRCFFFSPFVPLLVEIVLRFGFMCFVLFLSVCSRVFAVYLSSFMSVAALFWDFFARF
jgi:hypothetical protein